MAKAKEDGADWEQVAKTCVLFNIRRAARSITQLYDEVANLTGLRATQFSLLAAIQVAAPVNLKTLGGLLSMDPTTLARNLAPLKKRKFVSVESGADDRRERIVRITSQGRSTLDRAFPYWEKAQSEVLAELGTARVQRLLTDLSVVAQLRRDPSPEG